MVVVTQCKHCSVEIRQFNYGMGPEWLHIGDARGALATPYKICRPAPFAEPMTVEDGLRAAELLGYVPRHQRDD